MCMQVWAALLELVRAAPREELIKWSPFAASYVSTANSTHYAGKIPRKISMVPPEIRTHERLRPQSQHRYKYNALNHLATEALKMLFALEIKIMVTELCLNEWIHLFVLESKLVFSVIFLNFLIFRKFSEIFLNTFSRKNLITKCKWGAFAIRQSITSHCCRYDWIGY